MHVFLKLTLMIAAAFLAFLVAAFVLKLVVVAAIVAAVVFGALFLVNLVRGLAGRRPVGQLPYPR
jgi:hypothetical protein